VAHSLLSVELANVIAHFNNGLDGLLRVRKKIVIPSNVALGKHGNDSGPTILEVAHFVTLVNTIAWLCCIGVLDGANQKGTNKYHGEPFTIAITLERTNATVVFSENVQLFLDCARVDCDKSISKS
jgi:hypothetical protein